MSYSDSYQGRLDRVTERLSDLQRQIGNIENRNTNNMHDKWRFEFSRPFIRSVCGAK